MVAKKGVGGLLAGIALLALGAGCGEDKAPSAAPGPVEVGVHTVEPEPVALQRELPGRTSPYRIAEVRARVDGIVLERLFEEGADVKEGEPLFKIDPLPYRAALDRARATLARAEATVESAKLQAERYQELLKENAVSQQEVDNAVAAHKAAIAEVAAGRAAVRTAQIDLGYTQVKSPIAGRIGRSEVTEGAYVQRAQATRMATVQQLDPIYVDVTQSSAEVLRLRRELQSGRLQRAGEGAKVELILEDGTTYGEPGTLQFADVSVDPSTGSITLRALFPNPKGLLLPGMFVRARLVEGVAPEGILVPQNAVRRDAQGGASAMVVVDGKAELRPVKTERAVGNRWFVTDGLEPGDQVIVENLQRVRPGAPVKSVPATTAGAAEGAATTAAGEPAAK